HALGYVLGNDLADGVRNVSAFGVVAKLVGNSPHGIADNVYVVVIVGGEKTRVDVGPAGGLAVGALGDQVGIPDHVGRLVGRHQDGMVEVEIARSGFDPLVEGVDLCNPGIGYVGDDVRVQFFESGAIAFSDGRDLCLGIE